MRNSSLLFSSCSSLSCFSQIVKLSAFIRIEKLVPREPAACSLAPAALSAVLASLSNYQRLSHCTLGTSCSPAIDPAALSAPSNSPVKYVNIYQDREHCTLGTSSLLFSSCCSVSCSRQLVKYINIYQDRESTVPWEPAACWLAPAALAAALASLSNMSTYIKTESVPWEPAACCLAPAALPVALTSLSNIKYMYQWADETKAVSPKKFFPVL